MMRWLLKGAASAARLGLRCAECGAEITGTPVYAHGRVFCHPWHAERYPRTHPGFWRRLWEALRRSSGEAGGGDCC